MHRPDAFIYVWGLTRIRRFSFVVAHADLALELRLVDAHTERLGKQIECEKAGIVPGLFILPAGVAETRNEPGLGSVGRKNISEQNGHRGLFVDSLDRVGKDRRDVDVADLLGCVFGCGDRVEQHQLLDAAVFDALERRAGEHAVRGAGINLRCATDFDDRLRRVAKRARRVDHIIIEKAPLAL